MLYSATHTSLTYSDSLTKKLRRMPDVKTEIKRRLQLVQLVKATKPLGPCNLEDPIMFMCLCQIMTLIVYLVNSSDLDVTSPPQKSHALLLNNYSPLRQPLMYG